ncbi:MAG: hypothetical protein GY792_33435, partial [Gammaproteobacteria bacterium]|nr:hypothetical protein [Gammaproteobacteria bacterium]
MEKLVPPGGRPPSSSLTGPHWSKLRQRKHGGGSYYVRGHLLNHNLGGPGNTWANLTPLTQKANQDHHADFESRVKRAVNEEYR